MFVCCRFIPLRLHLPLVVPVVVLVEAEPISVGPVVVLVEAEPISVGPARNKKQWGTEQKQKKGSLFLW